MENALHQDGPWRETFPDHLYWLEDYQWTHEGPVFSGDLTVYLAGMVARQLDLDYIEDSREFLLDDPAEIRSEIRKHGPFIGQNAPIAFISRVNAEHMTFGLASGSEQIISLTLPASLFGIAAQYFTQAGNTHLGQIFRELGSQLNGVVGRISGYLAQNPGQKYRKSDRYIDDFMDRRCKSGQRDHTRELSEETKMFLEVWRNTRGTGYSVS